MPFTCSFDSEAISRTQGAAASMQRPSAFSEPQLPVRLEASESCPRYVGRVIRNVDVARPTPTWMQERLRRGGVRSIDAVVDVTNYVLLELGQPMHAFDLGKLNGGIVVRLAEQGESLALLDGQTVDLRADTRVEARRTRRDRSRVDASSPVHASGTRGAT